MKSNTLKKITLIGGIATAAAMTYASTDYGPAVWYSSSCTKYYTSGYGKKFWVCHVMEGYYHTLVSWQNDCSKSVSVHYAMNATKGATSDYPAEEIGQLVRDANYAWHAKCWNQHSMGIEHEGFVSNPAWFTTGVYSKSGALAKSKAEKYGFAKDRNHIVGHNEKSSSAWRTYASANLGIDPSCNTHSDPGSNWSWSTYMSYVNPAGVDMIVDNSSSGFSCSANWSTGTSSTDKYGSDYRYRSTAAVSDQATFTANLPSSGTYTVYCWYPQGANRCATTPYIIKTASGEVTVNVNQQANGGTWVNLGSYSMSAGAATIKISCWQAEGSVVMADAVRWKK